MRWRDQDPIPADRATPVEVFFDVVFVFTLTQLSHILELDLSWANAGRVLLLFAMLWWMYGGYVWLTNHVPPRRPLQKLLLLIGMAGFLMATIAMPHAFEKTGLLFGLAYLVVNCVHLILFTQSNARAALGVLAIYNLTAVGLVIAAAFQTGPAVYGLWIAAFLLQAVVPYLLPRWSWVSRAAAFHISVEHFLERHGLLIVIALGESVIAIGNGVDVDHLTATSVGCIVLALALPAGLWWSYFWDLRGAEKAMEQTEGAQRTRLALTAYFFAHIPMLLGIIVAAAGIHGAIAHPDQTDWGGATALAGGVSLFLAGKTALRMLLGIFSPWNRFLGAIAVAATIPVAAFGAGYQLAAIVAVLIATLAVDSQLRKRA